MRETFLGVLDTVSPACTVAAVAVVYLFAINMGLSSADSLEKAAIVPGVVGSFTILLVLFRKASEEQILAAVTAIWASLACFLCAMWMNPTRLREIVFFVFLALTILISGYFAFHLSKSVRLLPKLLIIPILLGGFYMLSIPGVPLPLVVGLLIFQFIWTTNDWPFWERLH